MSRFVDAIITYRILRKLTTPFNETDAFKQGIIDDKGKILKRWNDLNTVDERDAYTLLDRLVWRLKRIIEKVPYENKKTVSFAAALALIKEHHGADVDPLPSDFEHRLTMINEQSEYDLQSEMFMVENYLAGRGLDGALVRSFRAHLEEETPVNAVGAGFTNQANPAGNPNLAGPDSMLGKLRRRKKQNDR